MGGSEAPASRPKFKVGEHVWVPAALLTGDRPHALVRLKVREQLGRSVVVDDRDGVFARVSSRRAHHDDMGFLVLRVGDMQTEMTLLDPLAKSVLQYLRLLIPDDILHTLNARTEEEIERYFKTDGAKISHLVLIGHGTSTSLKTLGNELSGNRLGDLMAGSKKPKIVISLACETGKAGFGRGVSVSEHCQDFVAPFGAAHGAAASYFLQTLLHNHLLRAHGFKTSARIANDATEGTTFRHRRDGEMLK